MTVAKTDQTTKSADVVEKESSEIVKFQSNGVLVKELNVGTIAFFNTNLVTTKMIDLLCMGLEKGGFEHEGLGLFSIIFRNDGFPIQESGEKAQWFYFPDTYTAVCNIKHLIDICVTHTLDEKREMNVNLGIRASIWKAFLTGCFHEYCHAFSSLTEPGGHLKPEDIENDENRADEGAIELLFSLAKEYDIEMSFTPEMEARIEARITAEIEFAELEVDEQEDVFLQKWIDIQTHIKTNNGIWYQPEEDTDDFFMTSFKEFLHFTSGDDENDPEWAKATLPIPSITTQQNRMVVEEIDVQNPKFVGSADDAMSILENAEMDDDDIPWTPDEMNIGGREGIQQVIQNRQPTMAMGTDASVAPISVPPENTMAASPLNTDVNPQVVVGANMYPASTLDVATFQSVISGLYLKLFKHIFQECGFNPAGNPAFTRKENIATPVPLTDAENNIVKEMECYNGQGGKCPGTQVENFVSGVYIDKLGTLPAYILTLSDINGNSITRKFLPQNPNNASKTAAWAKQGHQILWIVDPDSTDKQFAVRIHNGVLQNNTSGEWRAI